MSLGQWIFTIFFLLLTIYSLSFTVAYVIHFNTDFKNFLPLYEFIKELPENSVIAIHSNKTRQINFISEQWAFKMRIERDPETIKLVTKEIIEFENDEQLFDWIRHEVTHLADLTCYEETIKRDVLKKALEDGKIKIVYEDQCSILYEFIREVKKDA